ncbi:MAG: hypothetical protein B6D57_04925 [Candidatus Coatesbacteria bacterium 4484_99]|uniref:GWxTD domain-containing protein n=1 Tax=Candidatus Coatesbacteria bacterium 4484_99 TaxID=1970774 RepID=A0A1W9S067_9BACT|nr:MAG: hypothetical protein B6D57_04925 [Candidatus Coatesbacteria bacterium 4484_99]
MIAVLLFLLNVEPINFYVEPDVYRTEVNFEDSLKNVIKKGELYYLEFNCSIPYAELSYTTKDDSIFSEVLIPVKVVHLNKGDSLIDTLRRVFTIPSFSYAAKNQLSFIVQFGLHLPGGRFEYSIKVLSGDKTGEKNDTLILESKDYGISDIMLASNIELDTVSNYLRKGSLRVIPHPSHIFNKKFNTLYLYYEIYDITPDSNRLSATYLIRDSNDKVVRKISRTIEKEFTSQAVNLGFNVQSLSPGDYELEVVVEDTATSRRCVKKRRFTVQGALPEEISFEGMPYYEDIEYFLSPQDYKKFKKLPKKGKKIFLRKFWRQLDYFEIAERFRYADKNFREGRTSGSRTDRGRIYVKFGKPDIREKHIMDYRESRPYEYWEYYNGYRFIFVDILGTNEYTLVWTNVRGERCQPTLYKYLPPDKQNIIK